MKPEWISNLTNTHADKTDQPEPIAWRVTWGTIWDCHDVDLGQFKDGTWFSGSCAGDTACEALERNYKQHIKGVFDEIDEGIRRGDMVITATMTPDMRRLLAWYIEAKRAELNRNP